MEDGRGAVPHSGDLSALLECLLAILWGASGNNFAEGLRWTVLVQAQPVTCFGQRVILADVEDRYYQFLTTEPRRLDNATPYLRLCFKGALVVHLVREYLLVDVNPNHES